MGESEGRTERRGEGRGGEGSGVDSVNWPGSEQPETRETKKVSDFLRGREVCSIAR
jgi:hypothetical protein